MASEEEVAECVKDLKTTLETSSLAETKAFIRSFVKEIRITGDDALMTYARPLTSGQATQERLPVLGIVRNGGR